MAVILTPQPVPCKHCFTILKATYAAQNDGLCPGCGEMACYTCGCVDDRACVRLTRSADGQHVMESICGWAEPGLCSFCHSEAAYVLYMEATGRVPSDPFYLRTYQPGETHHLAPRESGF